MEIQTQVIDEPRQTFTADEIQNQNAVAEYKDSLTHIRLNRITVVQQVKGISEEVKGLVESRESMIAMFRSEAEAMYPETSGQDVFQVMATISPSHPLYSLWEQYKGKVDNTALEIKDKFAQLDELTKAFEDYAAQEKMVFTSYSGFYAQATTPIATPAQLLEELQAVEVIPYVEENSLRADLKAIELLDPMAAAMVTLQTLEVASEGDYSESPEQLEHQADAQVRAMAFSFDEDSATPTLPQVAAVAPAVVAQMIEPNSSLKNLGICLGVAAFAYLIFGGKSNEK